MINWRKYLTRQKIMGYIRIIVGIIGIIFTIQWMSGEMSGEYAIITWCILLFGLPIINAILLWKYVKPTMWNLIYQLSAILYKKPLDIPIEKRLYPMGEDEEDGNNRGRDKELEESQEDRKRSEKGQQGKRKDKTAKVAQKGCYLQGTTKSKKIQKDNLRSAMPKLQNNGFNNDKYRRSFK